MSDLNFVKAGIAATDVTLVMDGNQLSTGKITLDSINILDLTVTPTDLFA